MAHPHRACQLHFPVDGGGNLAPSATQRCDGHHEMSLFAAMGQAQLLKEDTALIRATLDRAKRSGRAELLVVIKKDIYDTSSGLRA